MKDLILGNTYSKKDLSIIFDEYQIALVREGLYYSKKQRRTTLFFVDLEKKNKLERFKFNDYFEGDLFHWDSQTTQHEFSPKIMEMIIKSVTILLFARINPKIKSKTQPYIYCGKLEYHWHDIDTAKPVHMVFKLLDYKKKDLSYENLQKLYDWKRS